MSKEDVIMPPGYCALVFEPDGNMHIMVPNISDDDKVPDVTLGVVALGMLCHEGKLNEMVTAQIQKMLESNDDEHREGLEDEP